MAEHVVLFTGPMGAGKTAAIQSLSDIDPVRTEAANTDRVTADKPTTTVALDYGEITIGPDEKVRLYGIPGQTRFEFMWKVLMKRAVGMILLVNNDNPDPIGQMLYFIDYFHELYQRGGAVVAISRSDVGVGPSREDYYAALAAARPGLSIPIFSVDARSPEQMKIALFSLILNIESRAALPAGYEGTRR